MNNTRGALRELQHIDGYWTGDLSSSALSTATALQALCLTDSGNSGDLIEKGFKWLSRNQNEDGGWGDTTKSFSNLPTTLLAWSALGFADGFCSNLTHVRASEKLAEKWIVNHVGSIDPEKIVDATTARYGKDKTFSVPILMMCAIAGRLGDSSVAWRRVAPLPFELAVMPRSLFGALRLPVVSYALPALIAIGYARFHHFPPFFPLRFIRRMAWRRASRVLAEVQPHNGGFLEATPLTSFVTMALASAGEKSHPVVSRAVDFLRASALEDGSWRIDTNLSTWVTTLAVKGIVANGSLDLRKEIQFPQKIVKWLLSQQYLGIHPYTNAPPGGWAWTDLPGGVPDADDTSGALMALSLLSGRKPRKEVLESVEKGILWLLNLQNSDGGIPTFCRGWGTMPFDRSSPDITAHCIRAWDRWHDVIDPVIVARIQVATERAVEYLRTTQQFDGAWKPLWFGNENLPGENNLTYGTSQVVLALAQLSKRNHLLRERMLKFAIEWLEGAQNPDGGWGGGFASEPSSIEETALVTDSLLASGGCKDKARKGVEWLIKETACGKKFPPSPIGFYFAKLWYHEALYPMVWTASALARAAEK
ncbi:MAG: squalene--hopene cyclase [Verrucomicrobiaceae bacterium]|nr:squalene--hopene cyclase [Verrucomicrobiaceae bacterium]